MSWRFWEAPDTTISKRKSKSRTSFEEVEEEEEDEEEDDEDEEEEEDEMEKDTDYEAPEPEDTCAFQSEWQDWDSDDEMPKGDWWWRCELASQVDLKCQKDKCPFWNRNKGSHPFPQETTESDIIDEIKSRKKRNDRKKG
jgi:hypothetical protein